MNSTKSGGSLVAVLAVCVIGLALPVTGQSHAHYSRAELHKMMREASTAEQYRTLANWFREEEAIFRGKAEAENRDYEEYRKTRIPGKYPSRADAARGWRDYYASKADHQAALAGRYEKQLTRLDPSYHPVSASAFRAH